MYIVLAYYFFVDKDTEIQKEIHLYEGDKLIALQYEPEKTVSDIIESYLAVFLRKGMNCS